MKIGNILSPELAVANLAAENRDAAIEQLVSRLAGARGVDGPAAIKDVLAREKQLSTLIPAGPLFVAVPHAATTSCKQCVVALASTPGGVPWDATGKRASLIFLLLAPPHMQALYLKMLARIARLCSAPGFVDSMTRQTAQPPELVRTLAEAEAPLGDMTAVEGLPSFAVMGAGNGGMAMAAHLALSGCRVSLWNRSPSRLAPVVNRGGIDVTGEIHGFANVPTATADAAAAVRDADIVMVVLPATAHREVAEAIAPHLRDGQVLVLNPGRTGGALEVASVIRKVNPAVQPYIAETQTLLYASRVTNPGQVHVYRIKNSVPLATLPAYQIVDILPVIRKVLPQFIPGDNVLKTSLDNIGAIFHPAITILNAARIEDTHGDFEYYVQGVTPAVAAVLEALDRERVAVAGALGIRVNTAREWLYLAYDAAGKTLLEAMRANPGYGGIRAPPTVLHRYIWEDVPASLVPIASIGEMLNVPTPGMRAMIHTASLMHNVDYWKEGRTVDKLGIKGLSVKDIRFRVAGAESAALAPASPAATARGMSDFMFDHSPQET